MTEEDCVEREEETTIHISVDLAKVFEAMRKPITGRGNSDEEGFISSEELSQMMTYGQAVVVRYAPNDGRDGLTYIERKDISEVSAGDIMVANWHRGELFRLCDKTQFLNQGTSTSCK